MKLARTYYCSALVVHVAHPEHVTVVGIYALVQGAMSANPVFLPQSEPAMEQEDESLPSCPERDHTDDFRRLQLKMKMPGSNWDMEILRQLEQAAQTRRAGVDGHRGEPDGC